MADKDGVVAATCLMVVAYVDKATHRAADWPEDVAALFFER
jgi:acyl-CoA thioester hydrolase